MLFRLALSNLAARKARLSLTVAAVALGVSLVVSVTSGYKTAAAAAYKFLNQYLGATDAQVYRAQDPRPGIDEKVVEMLRADPDVRHAVGRLETESVVFDSQGKVSSGARPTFNVFGVRADLDDSVQRLPILEGRWFGPDEESPNVVVIDQGARERLKVHAGDSISLPGSSSTPVSLKIVGVVYKPNIVASQVQSIYLPLATAQGTFGFEKPNRVSKISIEFKPDINDEAFTERWRAKLETIDPLLKLRATRDSRETLDKNLQGISILSFLGGAVSLVTATFIVFSTLSMGVTERQRTLAMLRAVGAVRAQVGLLVIIEGLLLTGTGVAIGVPLGWLWVRLLVAKFHGFFVAGVVMSWPGIALAVGGSLAAALAASLMPALAAMRVSPLEAMSPQAGGNAGRYANFPPVGWAILGAGLALLDTLMLSAPMDRAFASVGLITLGHHARAIEFYSHFFLGLPGIMLGFFLLGPLVVWIIERVAVPPVALIAGVRSSLLKHQLSGGGLWRAAGTCAALMVGLAVLIVMQTQGTTILQGWRLPDKFPDVFIYNKAGIDRAAQQEVAKTPQVQGEQAMPIAMFSPQFGGSPFAIYGALMLPDATMFFGLDPKMAFDLMELEFRAGNVEQAKRMMIDGQTIKLKDGTTFDGATQVRRAATLTIGADNTARWIASSAPPATQPFAIATTTATKPNTAPSSSQTSGGDVDVVIIDPLGLPPASPLLHHFIGPDGKDAGQLVARAGDVSSSRHGHYLIITEELRQLKGFKVGDDFALKSLLRGTLTYKIVGVVWSPGIDVMVSTFDLGKQFEQRTASSVFGTLQDARDDFGIENVYLMAANLKQGVDKQSLIDQLTKNLGDKGFNVADVRSLKFSIQQGLAQMLLIASSVAWAAMLVASLGVANTVMASVRSRRWQFGVLRSIGVTRGGLLRLVLAEALLLGLVGCLLGVGAGALMTYNARQFLVLIVGFVAPVSVPWEIVWLGAAIVVAISLAASIYPAIKVARTEPLSLLQAGRAAA